MPHESRAASSKHASAQARGFLSQESIIEIDVHGTFVRSLFGKKKQMMVFSGRWPGRLPVLVRLEHGQLDRISSPSGCRDYEESGSTRTRRIDRSLACCGRTRAGAGINSRSVMLLMCRADALITTRERCMQLPMRWSVESWRRIGDMGCLVHVQYSHGLR